MSTRTLTMTDQLYDYLLKHSVRESNVLKNLRRVTSELPMAVMQISPEQGQFMALLIQLMGARKTLEIGTFTGYSTLAVAQALPPGGKVIACDVSEEWTAIARDFWQQAGVAHKIDLRLAPALETLDQLIKQDEANTFDFVFIDADKGNYLNYYEKSLQLLRRGGLIAIDNTLWSGEVADPAINDAQTTAIRELNDHLLQDDRISLSLLPIGDGLTLALKKQPSSFA